MNTIAALNRKEKRIKAELAKLPQRKWEVLFLIPFFALCCFLIPGIPGRRKGPSMAETMGYWEAFTAIAILFSIVLPYMIYSHIQKVNDEILDLERQLRRIKYKRKEAEEMQTSSTKNTDPTGERDEN